MDNANIKKPVIRSFLEQIGLTVRFESHDADNGDWYVTLGEGKLTNLQLTNILPLPSFRELSADGDVISLTFNIK